MDGMKQIEIDRADEKLIWEMELGKKDKDH